MLHFKPIKTFYPVLQCLVTWHAKCRFSNLIRPVCSLWNPREIEKRHICARISLIIGKKQMICPDVILIDRFFDQAHTQYIREKFIILFRTASDGSDVVHAFYAIHENASTSTRLFI